jgi:uncharacterized protein
MKLPLYILGLALSLFLLMRSFQVDTKEVFREEPSTVRTSSSDPLKSVEAYVRSAREGDLLQDPSLYTDASVRMLEARRATKEQMANAVRSYEQCQSRFDTIRYDNVRQRAVIRYRVGARTCHPWFLTRSDFSDTWQIDLTEMRRAIRFNRQNYWHLAAPDTPYRFGFDDWRFDDNGYPLARRAW